MLAVVTIFETAEDTEGGVASDKIYVYYSLSALCLLYN